MKFKLRLFYQNDNLFIQIDNNSPVNFYDLTSESSRKLTNTHYENGSGVFNVGSSEVFYVVDNKFETRSREFNIPNVETDQDIEKWLKTVKGIRELANNIVNEQEKFIITEIELD